jgi:hypothetical protein
MTNYKQFQQARTKGCGNFKTLQIDICDATKIYVDFYNNGGRWFGGNAELCKAEKFRAKEQFMKMLAEWLCEFRGIGWEYKVSFDFGDDR